MMKILTLGTDGLNLVEEAAHQANLATTLNPTNQSLQSCTM
jgi:hypothetical protein